MQVFHQSNHNNGAKQLSIAQLTNPQSPYTSPSHSQSTSPSPSQFLMVKHTNDDHFLRTFTFKNHHLPIHKVKQCIQQEFSLKSSDYLYIKLLSCHCIYNMFKLQDLPPNHDTDHSDVLFITKQRAYDCFQNFYRLFYTTLDDDTYPRLPGFGKLIKGLYEGRVQTKRVGARARSNYCFTNFWIKDHIWEILKTKGVDVNVENILLGTKQSKIWQIYGLFCSNKQISVETYFQSELERDLYNSIIKCDEFFDHFVKTLSLNAVVINDITNRTLAMLISDWNDINVHQILSRSLNIESEGSKYYMFQLSQTIASFPQLFQTLLNENSSNARVTSDEQIQRLKKQMINTLTSIHKLARKLVKSSKNNLSNYGISESSNTYLNFQFIVTEILRALTMNQKPSFSAYWILSCFVNEFIRLSIKLESL